MNRPSLNAPCPCGSGKRYRKCCAERDLIQLPRLFGKANAQLAKRVNREREFTERYGHIRMPMSTSMPDGSRFFVVGGGILRSAAPQSFVTTVHDVGLLFFGEDYLAEQEALPFEHRHTPIQWMHAWIEEHNKAQADVHRDPRALQIAAGAAWLRLAFDLYTIQDNSTLSAERRKKLIDPAHFQGARHELAVAALWVAAGFTLEYENEKDVSRTHPEFIAKDRFSDLRVAVEAKSNHRTGVQGYQGGNPGNARRANVRKLLEAAYRKKVDLPLYAFLDLNLPRPVSADERLSWVREIHQTVDDMTAEGAHAACPVNAVFFLNDPSHYLMRERLVDETDVLWMVTHLYLDPKISHPVENIVDRIERARIQRIAPPDDYWDDE